MGDGMRGEASIHIDALPERVWELISDVTRMGEWSPETFRCTWLGGATKPEPGARFRGWNRKGLLVWMTTPEVKVADQPRQLSFVTKLVTRDGTLWTYRLEPEGGGTRVTESFEVLYEPKVIELIMPPKSREPELVRGMEATLARIKAAAEATAPAV